MQLIGMLDSPYVRRVAISLQLLGLRFEHRSLSVFRDFDRFRQINPVVKAPTLVCDDGEVLMDSTLILQYAEVLARPRSLMPAAPVALQRTLHVIGLALAATEKSVQLVYERDQRPPDKQHPPWLARVTGQMQAAYDALEQELAHHPLAVGQESIDQAGITTAAGWRFAREMVGDLVPVSRYPLLAGHSEQAEALPEFRAAPFDGTYGQADHRDLRGLSSPGT